MPVIYGEFQTAPSIFTMQGEARVRSQFYATDGAKLIYTLETVGTDLESRDSGLVEITAAIAERLRRDGLIR